MPMIEVIQRKVQVARGKQHLHGRGQVTPDFCVCIPLHTHSHMHKGEAVF